jgi:hypothetical protein
MADEKKVVAPPADAPKTAQYKVLRPIELDGKLYLPESKDAPVKARSAGNGAIIPVDASGVIELTEAEAKQMVDGQIAPMAALKKKK